jgi:ATP-dependent RNA helicase DeaD
MELSEPRETQAPARHESAPGFVRFSINWGESDGAAPNRLLGHVCRRGDIRGNQVGSIDIGPDESSFDVDASIASRFEKLVRRRDPRDPKLVIHRAGPARGPSSRPRDTRGRDTRR